MAKFIPLHPYATKEEKIRYYKIISQHYKILAVLSIIATVLALVFCFLYLSLALL